jgi:acyl-CoA synthetase (AMP-forming)/AMP-acid ligase II
MQAQIRQFILTSFLFTSDESALNSGDSLLERGIMDSTGVLELVASQADPRPHRCNGMSSRVPLLRQLEQSVGRRPDAEAIVQGTRRVSYAELWAQVSAVAGFLRAHGAKTGDRIAIVMENSPEYVAAYYGAWAAGAVAVGLNAAARARELVSWVGHCGASWLFVDGRHPDFAQLAALGSAGLRVVAIGSDRPSGVVSWDEVLVADPPAGHAVSAELAAIIYTSGTTGRPKGVMLSHDNLAANAAAIIQYLGLSSIDRTLNLLPFFYSYGSSVLHTHLAAGAALVLENHLVYPQRIAQRMVEERVTGLPGVPSTFAVLLQSGVLERTAFPALRYVTQAGGAMPPHHISRLRQALPETSLFIMYGQTEASARLTYLPTARLGDKLGSVGLPIAGVELEIRGEGGRRLPATEPGEVCVRGPNVMRGYYNDEEATAQVLRDGWLYTGDIGYLDADGFLFLQGRKSDIIKSGAHRICPTDIEEVISAMTEVAEVAVVGLPDAVLGEAIGAVIVLRSGAALDPIAVQRHCSRHLPRYKVPKSVEFVDRLPRTSSGKVQRYMLTGIGI